VVDVAPDGVRTGYGNTVIVEHPGGVLTLHAHLKSFGPGIRVGTVVERGDVLGYVGATHLPSTNAMAPHLHFEVLLKKVLYRDKIVVNPQTPGRTNPEVWLKQSGVRLAA
jgi:murein DD-endopeptidase MepM/ murein hydrolase activator NlpD